MTENLTVAGAGAGESPNSQVSAQTIEGAEKPSGLLTAEQVEKLLKPLTKQIEGLQSRVDKTSNAQQEFIEEYEKQKASGKSNAEAQVAATSSLDGKKKAEQREALLDQIAEKLGILPNQSVGNAAGGAVDTAKVIEDLGLDMNNVEVAAAAQVRYPSPEAAKAAMLDVFVRQKQKPLPSDADRATVAGTSAVKGNYQDMATEMESLVKNYTQNIGKINELEKRMKESQQ